MGANPLLIVKLWTPFARKQGEDATRYVHERILNGRIDKDVDELQRIDTNLNPASVILLIPAPAGRLFDAHWRDLFSSRGSRKEQCHWLTGSWVCYTGADFVEIVRGHSGLFKGALSASRNVSRPSQHSRDCLDMRTLACHAVGPFGDQRR